MTLTRVNSNGITDGTIVNADVSASAAIAGTKISPDFGSQAVTTTGTSTAASFIPTSSSVPANGVYLPGANSLGLATASTERVRVTSAGLVGIGTTSPGFLVDCIGSSTPTLRIDDGAGSGTRTAGRLLLGATTSLGVAIENSVSSFNDVCSMVFKTTPAAGTITERARIDSAGRLLVGTSSASGGSNVHIQDAGGAQIALRRGEAATSITTGEFIGGINFQDSGENSYASIVIRADANAGSSDYPGRIEFSVTTDGSASPTEAMRLENTGTMRVSGTIYRNGSCGIRFSGAAVIPQGSTGDNIDNGVDLGLSGARWRTIYAGTGTINTSDFKLKQDVEELDQAELSVAATIKGLIKKFRFTDAVAAKGNDARIHVGVIAQEVEQAFAAEGLNPRRYGMFCEDTLEDGSKRLGIRYDELLAFVIAAT